MKVISLDLRERIVAAYQAGEGSQPAIAVRFRVSVPFVKKLLKQWRETGDLNPRYWVCGRKPLLQEKYGEKMKELLRANPDMTLRELRDALGVDCTEQAIFYVLKKMGLTYKKRHSGPASRIGRISPKSAAAGKR